METITEIKVDNKNIPGLMDLIREAGNEEEVKMLVVHGKENYSYASSKTIKKWDRVAKERIEELNVTDDIIPDTVVVKTEKKKIIKTEKRKTVKK